MVVDPNRRKGKPKLNLKNPELRLRGRKKVRPGNKESRTQRFEVLIDSNEGHRIPFGPYMRWRPPGVQVSQLIAVGSRAVNLGRLENGRGDITLEGYTHVVGIERKGKTSELWHDLKTGKLERQFRVMSGLVEYCYLLLDIPVIEFWGTESNARFDEEDATPTVMDRVLPMAQDYGFGVIGPVTGRGVMTRRALGEYLMRVMLSRIGGKKFVYYKTIPKK